MDEKTKKFFQEKTLKQLDSDAEYERKRDISPNERGGFRKMSEAIQLIKAKFEQTDTVLKEIGLQLCELHKQNQLIKARLNKLEAVKDDKVELDE